MTDFSGKIVIVTGGAQNIGLAIARKFKAAGANVIAADLNPPDVEAGFAFFKTDIAKESDVINLMQYVQEHFGRLDALVNNAGICLEVPIHEMSVEAWDKTMSIMPRVCFLQLNMLSVC